MSVCRDLGVGHMGAIVIFLAQVLHSFFAFLQGHKGVRDTQHRHCLGTNAAQPGVTGSVV